MRTSLIPAAANRGTPHASLAALGAVLIRTNAGGGTLANVNALLNAGYHYHGKDYSGLRAVTVAARGRTWHVDPAHPPRAIRRVRPYRGRYPRPVMQGAVR